MLKFADLEVLCWFIINFLFLAAIRSGDYYLFHEIKHSSSVDKKEVTTSMTYGREAFEKEEAVVGPFQVSKIIGLVAIFIY